MHILLTDLLTCPRCGPDFGLILRGDRIDDRRVLEGELGCPNCRERYPVRGGFGDLRAPPREPFRELPVLPPEPEPGDTERLAALLGVARGPGHLVLIGGTARHARGVADMLENVEVVGVGPWLRARDEEPGVSRIAARPGLPFYPRRIRGVALPGAEAETFLDEAIRVVGPRSRVAVLDAPEGARKRMEAGGLSVLLDDRGIVVGGRE